jgi:hypothetical protein
MSKQTINIGASPNDGTGTPLRTSFDYTNQNFTEIYTALGGGVALPGATTQVIFNDGGTNLAGDAGLVYNKTTDALTVAGLVTAGSATITGAATVGTTLGVTGVATVSGAHGGNYSLNLVNTTNNAFAALKLAGGGTLGGGEIDFYNGATSWAGIKSDAINQLKFLNGAFATLMTLDASGNLGVGVTPSAWGSAFKVVQLRSGSLLADSGGSTLYNVQNVYFDGSSWLRVNAAASTRYEQSAGVHTWWNAPTGTVGTAANFTQAMTLDASGNLVIGNALASGVGATGGLVSVPNSGNSYHLIGHTTGTASGANFTYYFYAGSVIGSITQNGTTGVLFNTSSDYRLKESVKPISGGLARVNALKPSSYNWKSDGSAGEGFLAHELAEVVPAAVSGEKDAVNADGTIKSQGIDMSRIVPILVAAIKELTARVQTLEAR